MKKLFNTGTPDWLLDLVVLAARLATGGMMLTHGWPKLEKLMAGGEISFSDPIGLGPAASLILVVFAEFFCSIFIMMGLGTRIAAIAPIVTMCVAAFVVHAPDPLRRKETALLYLALYLILLVTGSRKYSVDRLLFGKVRQT